MAKQLGKCKDVLQLSGFYYFFYSLSPVVKDYVSIFLYRRYNNWIAWKYPIRFRVSAFLCPLLATRMIGSLSHAPPHRLGNTDSQSNYMEAIGSIEVMLLLEI